MTDPTQVHASVNRRQIQERLDREVRERYRGALSIHYSGAHLHRTGDDDATESLCGRPLYVPHRAPAWKHDKLCPACRSIAAEETRAAYVQDVTAATIRAAREAAEQETP